MGIPKTTFKRIRHDVRGNCVVYDRAILLFFTDGER
jgi:hypothetical protein